jgi:lipopolysaccharide transport system permease protein
MPPHTTARQFPVPCDLLSSGPPDHAEERVARIVPTRGWRSLGVRDLWSHRELVFFFAWRDVKVRYKQTALGVVWAVLQPLVTMALFYVVFHRVAKVSSGRYPYAAFAMAGVAPWVFISNGFALAANGLVQNANLVAKTYFPRLSLPLGSILACLVDLAASLVITEIILLGSGVRPTVHLLALPLCVILALTTTFGLGAWLAALQVYYRDVKYIVPLFTQALMFATPIAYAASAAGGVLKSALLVNPVTGPVEAFRWALLGRADLSGSELALSMAVTLLLLGTALMYFRRVERAFADAI